MCGDIGNIGAEPQRAQKIAFTAAYCEIEATYMVPEGSAVKSIADVDKKGIRIAVSARSAYDLWLENNIKNATLIRVSGLDAAYNKFVEDKLDVLAGLRPGLLKDIEKAPATRSSTASSRPSSRRSARPGPIPKVRPGLRPSSRRPRSRGWLRASSPNTR